MSTVPQTVSPQFMAPRARVFGDDFAPPRQLYFTLIPAVLSLSGILSWIMGNQAGLLEAGFVGSIVAIYSLWEWLFRRAPTRFSTLMAITLLLGYGFGTMNTWATMPRGSLTLADVKGLGDGVLARGLGAVLISSALLYFLGEIFEKPIFGRDFRLEIDGRTRALVLAGMLTILVGYATRSVVFEGAATTATHVSPFGLFVGWLYTPITCLAFVAFLEAPHLRLRLLMGLVIIVLLLTLAVLGRRPAIYSSAEIIFVLGLTGYWRKGNAIRKVLILAGLAAMVIICSLAFVLFRVSGNMVHQRQAASVEKRLQVAQTLMEKGEAYQLAVTNSRQNVESRTFILAFLSNVLDASLHQTPALGSDLVMNLTEIVPSIIYPEKAEHDAETEEQLDDRQFGFGYGDQANSILTAGATDFGLAGVLFYPLLIIVVFRACYSFFTIWFKGIPLFVMTLYLILILLQAEIQISGYFGALRNDLLFGIAIALFMAFPRIRLWADAGAGK